MSGYYSSNDTNLRSILLCCVIFLFLLWFLRRPRYLPPGPWGLPILGSLPYLVYSTYRSPNAKDPHRLFDLISCSYGKTFSLRVFGKVIVVLNTYEGVNEAFKNRLLIDRPRSPLLPDGIIFASGDSWRQQRRFSLVTLRGFGKNIIEEQIARESSALLDEFKKQNQDTFDPQCLLGKALSNVICSLVFGHRYNYTDTDFNELLELLSEEVEFSVGGGIIIFFPFLRYFLPKLFGAMKENINRQMQVIDKIVDQHRIDHHDHDPEHPKDFIYAFLTEIEKNKKDNLQSYINDQNLVMTIQNLFAAGSETTATTLRWVMLYMMAYPDIHHRVQKEIDNVVGRHRLPRLSDMLNLPYTGATLLEIQRIVTIVPTGVIHSAAADTTLHGFSIPKGTFLISNLWAVHHDPSVWEEPSKFNPSRFLDSSGNLLHRPELIPFSTGRRICLGENLANATLSIFFTHMMHQFNFTKPTDSTQLSLEGVSGGTYQPKPFNVIATPRQ